ncbi:MAG TPA: chromate resistance protein ChrB domain-containing protein [Lacunisphaera sp.]|jgi:hypothetical protein|nr:chromate resistance protein ChrB domain-containing protein [Lacunisphaera sp.]
MKWITRERIKVDRVACPWLIKRFIDPEAEFIFKPVAEVLRTAERLPATPFDTPGAKLDHRGERVTFEVMLDEYWVRSPALGLLGEIVRAADSKPARPHPAGEGLRWIAHGFGLLGLTDHQILAREFIVYDALYAECQRQVGASGS